MPQVIKAVQTHAAHLMVEVPIEFGSNVTGTTTEHDMMFKHFAPYCAPDHPRRNNLCTIKDAIVEGQDTLLLTRFTNFRCHN